MRIEFVKANAALTHVFARKPSITGATRLETQPTSVAMKASLQAPLADPLWLLSRQWQFNELQGEDAGTPLAIRFAIDGTRVDAYRAGKGDGAWTPIGVRDVPIETRVEAEPVWSVHRRFVGEAGLQALRTATPAVRDALLAAYPLALPKPTDGLADRAGLAWSTFFDGRTVDARLLAADLRPLVDAGGALTGLPAALAVDAGEVDGAKVALARWLAFFDGIAVEGDAANAAWQPNRMEYAFALKAGTIALASDEYTDGHVDWDDFRARGLSQSDPAGNDQPTKATFAVERRHPSPVRYPGMPAERYWEFEDGQVNFAGAEAGITDLLRMCVTEFALTFGNDWFVVPVRLPVGWLHRVARFEITDGFGITASAGPATNPAGAQWTIYSMTADDAVRPRVDRAMLLPDSLDGVQEGAVLEETLLARDEMANLAWAIERRVQGVSGEPLDRELEAKALAFQQRIRFDDAPTSPQLVYRLQTPVPANWIPLLPTRDAALNLLDPLTIRLARAGMTRFYPKATVALPGTTDDDYAAFLALLDQQGDFVTGFDVDADLRAYVFHPRGRFLRRDPDTPMPDDDTLVVEEEEVPRIGATLKRKFQYARSFDGRSWLWIGRSKTAGRGEASSSLKWDVAVKKETLR